MDKLPNIYFDWEDRSYYIPPDTRVNRILLPDGQVLAFSGINDDFLPPKLTGLRGLCFTVGVSHGSNLKSISFYLQAVLAVRISKVKFSKKCPNGHLNQNDVYCSICRYPLELTETITPYKPPKS